MANKSFQRLIRFTKNEWDTVVEVAENAEITPGSFVRKAAARAVAGDLYLYGGGLTPELAALIERTFRGAHLVNRASATPAQLLTKSFPHLTDRRRFIGADQGCPTWLWNDQCG